MFMLTLGGELHVSTCGTPIMFPTYGQAVFHALQEGHMHDYEVLVP